jgi:hypothetical protein
MNRLNGLVVAGLSIALMAGCASTSDSTQNTAPVSYPELKVLSDKPYVWDNSISEALNVARMAQPAGVGNGMQDFPDGKKATTGRIGGGERAFDAGLGLLSQGVFGVVSMEALNQGVNKQLDWKPSLIVTVNKADVSDVNGINFVKTRNLMAEKFINALKKEYSDFELIGVFTTKFHKQSKGDSVVAFRTKGCADAAVFDAYYSENAKVKSLGVVNGFIEGPVELNDYCAVEFKTSVSMVANEKLVLVAELHGTLSGSSYFNTAIAKHVDGYFLVPEYYEYLTSDRRGVYKAVATRYAKVFKNGKEILFESK